MIDPGSCWQKTAWFKYLWIFATEKCNLKCSYCFFRHRKDLEEISSADLETLFAYFPQLQKAEFVISGGEPTLAWTRTKDFINYLRTANPDKYLLLQTNATLLDKSRLSFFKKKKVALEVGFDGNPAVNNRSRRGIRKHLPGIERTFRQAAYHNVPVSITMTITPSTAQHMLDNYLYLLNLKIKKVEITPQALGRWEKHSAALFEIQYRRVVRYASDHGLLDTLSLEYDTPLKKYSLDLILTPDKLILSNWALLFLPRKLREKYSLGRLLGKKIAFNKSFSDFYGNQIIRLFASQGLTYRDLSHFYIKEVCKNISSGGLKQYYYYEHLGQILKSINQRLYAIRGRS